MRSRIVWSYAAVMAMLGLLLFAVPALNSFVWAGIGLCSAGAVVAGIRLNRPRRVAPWWALSGGIVAMMAGDFVYGLSSENPGQPPSTLSDVCYLAMFPVVGWALIGLTRTSATFDDRPRLLDLLAFGCGAALAGWVVLISPQLGAGMTPTEWSIQAGYTLGDLMVLVVTVRLTVAARRNVASVLLAVGAVGMLIGDVAYGVAQAHGHDLAPGGAADLAYVLLYAAWGAAALQPSMTDLTAAPEPVAATRGGGIVVLLVAVAIAPLVLLVEAMTGPVRDGPVIALTAGITLVLLVTRLTDAIGKHVDAVLRESTLRRAGTALVVATDAAGVVRAVRSAVHTLIPPATDHETVVDFEVADIGPLAPAPRLVAAAVLPWGLTGTLGRFEHVLVCPLDAGVLYVGAPRSALLTVQDSITVLAGQAALTLARIALTDAVNRRDSDAYLTAVFQHTSDVVLVIDDDQRIRYASPSSLDVLGVEPAPLASLDEIIAPEDYEQVADTLSRAPDADTTAGIRDCWSLLRPDGTRVLVEVSYRDLHADRLVRGMVITMCDITERRRSEQEPARRSPQDSPAGQNRENSSRKFR